MKFARLEKGVLLKKCLEVANQTTLTQTTQFTCTYYIPNIRSSFCLAAITSVTWITTLPTTLFHSRQSKTLSSKQTLSVQLQRCNFKPLTQAMLRWLKWSCDRMGLTTSGVTEMFSLESTLSLSVRFSSVQTATTHSHSALTMMGICAHLFLKILVSHSFLSLSLVPCSRAITVKHMK